MVLATSNCPWDIDEAILGRFEKRIYVPLPKRLHRRAALELHLKGVKHDVDVDALADLLEGYSGADIRLICKDASMMFMRSWVANKSTEEITEKIDTASLDAIVTMKDFKTAIRNTNSLVKDISRYEKWAKAFAAN